MPSLPDQLAGVKIFPCEPGGKLPALREAWQFRATDDSEQVEAWERTLPNLNWGVACGPSGIFVFDIDPAGLPTWEAMLSNDPALRDAVAKSFTVKTPRGGFHHYFRGHGPTTVNAVSEGIDTRGGYPDESTGRMKSTGYVVLPGSITSVGEYRYLGGELLPMPEAIKAIVPERKKGRTLGLERDPAKDQPRNVEWAKDLLNKYVREGHVAVSGSGGNDLTFRVAASIIDKAISPAKAFELMDGMWNVHCSPPWEDWELEKVILNAAKYGEETEAGSKGFEDNQSAFANFAGMETPPAPENEIRRRDRVQWIDDYAAGVQDPKWLLPGILPAIGSGMLFGPSGSYKSFLALDFSLCISHGHAGQWGAPMEVQDVLYFAGEAPIGTARQRVPAWKRWQGVDRAHRLAIFPRVPPLNDGDGWAGIKMDIDDMGMKPKLIVIDTLARLLTGYDENSTKDAIAATGFVEDLARYYECMVLVVHHTGKDESKGARGSSAFHANFDTVLSVKKKGQGTSLRVRKHKDADAPDDEIYLQVQPFVDSIVLSKAEAPADEVKRTETRIRWSDPVEIRAILQRNGGRLIHAILCQEIMGDLGLEKRKVSDELKKREDLAPFRDGEFWALPTEEKVFDL